MTNTSPIIMRFVDGEDWTVVSYGRRCQHSRNRNFDQGGRTDSGKDRAPPVGLSSLSLTLTAEPGP